MTDTTGKPLGDSFAVAILQWPAVVGAVVLDGAGWEFALRILLAGWAVLVSLGLIAGRSQGPRWGLVMTLCAALAAGLWLSVPTLWALAWFVALVIAFHAGVSARMQEGKAQNDRDGDAAEKPV